MNTFRAKTINDLPAVADALLKPIIKKQNFYFMQKWAQVKQLL